MEATIAQPSPARQASVRLRPPAPTAAAGLPFQWTGALRHLLAALRVSWMLLFTPAACLAQSILLMTSCRGRVAFAVFYWNSLAHLLGLRVRAIGAPLGKTSRPVIYVCNHSSWMDIPALGGCVRACFVAKDDVAGWPIVGTIARLGRTVFVSRSRLGIERERDQMQERLVAGDDLILFPEGTSSDGSRVLPFHSSFFAAAYGAAAPLIQPVSIVYDRLAGLPVTRSRRTIFAWYGDMDLAPHLWQAAQWRGKRVSLQFHPPLDPAHFASRKALSQAAWQVIADGAATLRQNRHPYPANAAAPPAAELMPA